ncbi:hypothetical protein ES703_28494 [subsurface metagenome]
MKKAGEILKSLLDEEGKRNAHLYSSFFRGWQKIVGTSLAEHSRVYDIKNKILLVEVDHPGWLQRLHFKKRAILRLVRKLYPELDIHDLKGKVVLSFSAYSKELPQRAKDIYPADDKRLAEIDRIVSGVKEGELRERLKTLFLGALQKEKDSGTGRSPGIGPDSNRSGSS